MGNAVIRTPRRPPPTARRGQPSMADSAPPFMPFPRIDDLRDAFDMSRETRFSQPVRRFSDAGKTS